MFGIYFLYLRLGQSKPDTDWTKQIVLKRLNFNRQAMITLLPEPWYSQTESCLFVENQYPKKLDQYSSGQKSPGQIMTIVIVNHKIPLNAPWYGDLVNEGQWIEMLVSAWPGPRQGEVPLLGAGRDGAREMCYLIIPVLARAGGPSHSAKVLSWEAEGGLD